MVDEARCRRDMGNMVDVGWDTTWASQKGSREPAQSFRLLTDHDVHQGQETKKGRRSIEVDSNPHTMDSSRRGRRPPSAQALG